MGDGDGTGQRPADESADDARQVEQLTQPITRRAAVADLAAVGTVLRERYRLDAVIGRGGMASVFRGRDLELERDVAIKVLDRRSELEDVQRERHLREARAAAALNHAHIVTVHDVGVDDRMPFIVMEVVEGGNLRQVGALELRQIVDLALQLSDALAHIHAHGIVHRDLKPENVLVSRADGSLHAKITDLGIALAAPDARITEEGVIVGTAMYLAPEQAVGGEVDARADLYALGVVLYELLAGRPPFSGNNIIAVISQHLHAPVVPPRAYRPDVPAALERLVLALLEKDPLQRLASARDLHQGLSMLDTGELTARVEPTEPTEPGAGHDAVLVLEELARGRLVARDTELRELHDLWRRARQGHGLVALVSGEPGVGKSRLAREFQVSAQLDGAVLLSGGCYEYEATTPYLPFVEALRDWVHRSPTEMLEVFAGPFAGELAKLAPELDARLPAVPEAPRLAPHEERLRLFDHCARFVEGLAASKGLVLLLEDLHWADQGTIGLLHYLLRRLRDARLLVVVTYREVELDRVHPLSKALQDWNRERLAARIHLGRLSLAGTNALLSTLLSQESVSDGFCAAIHQETEGNPFFIEETVKALIDQGQIYRRDGEWFSCDTYELIVPQSVRDAIGRRLDRLGEGCVDVLHVAAVIGKSFAFAELTAAVASSEDEVVDALDEAVCAQLLTEGRDESFVFTHDKIREVLVEELNPIRRRRIHRRVAESLEACDRPADHAQDLAHHYLEGGVLEKGMEWAMAAAEQAERVFAHDEAQSYLGRARECAEELEHDALRRIEEMSAAVFAASGDSQSAAACLEKVLALTESPAEQLVLKARIGEAYSSIGDARGAELLRQAMAGLDPESQPLALARATAMMGRYHHYDGEHRRAVELLERGLALAEPHDDPALVGTICSYIAGAYQHLALVDESDRWARRCTEMDDPATVALGYEFLSENQWSRGGWQQMIEFAERDREIGEKIQSWDRIAWSLLCETVARARLGELARAEEIARQGIELAERIGDARVAVLLRAELAPVVVERGRVDDARAIASAADEAAERLGGLYLRLAARGTLAALSRMTGEFATAAEQTEFYHQEIGGGRERERIALLGYGPERGEALLRVGRIEECATLIDEVLELARGAGTAHSEATALRVKGMLEGLRAVHGSSGADGFEVYFARAIKLLEGQGSRVDLARTLVERARVFRAGDRDEEADADLTRAIELYETCGSVHGRVEAQGLLGV